MLHTELETALNKQVNLELWSGYLYLSMSYYMNETGFCGMAKWFYKQAKEEFEHAEKIANHIISLEGKVKLTSIGDVKHEWNSPKAAFEDTLQHEKQVSASIRKLYEQALQAKAYPTVFMLEWFIAEQVEEEENPRNIIAAIKKIETDLAAMYLFDQKLGN